MNYSSYFAAQSVLKKMGFDIERAEVISEVTNNRKSSLKELTPFEYRELVNHLNRIIANSKSATHDAPYQSVSASGPQSAINQDWQSTPENIMRRKILALFYKMNYRSNGKTDVNRVNEWSLKYGRFKKPLNKHTREELTQLVSQVEKVYQSFIETL
jgi:site-specific DNA-adenine methylase